MSKQDDTIAKLLRLLNDLYEHSQSPILTRDLFKSHKGNRSLFNDYIVGSSYKIEVFIALGIFNVIEEISPRKIRVVWGTRKPDWALATELFNKRTKPNPNKHRNNTEKKKIKENYTEKNSGIDTLDDYTEENLEAFINYSPNGTTIPKLTQAMLALRKNTKNGFCHRDKMYVDEILNDNGNFETVDCSPDNNYNPTRLTTLGITEVNPDNGKEYRFIVEPQDFIMFVRQLAFYVHNCRNGGIKKKVETPVQETTEEITVVETPNVMISDELVEAVNSLTEQVKVLTQNSIDNNKLMEVSDKITEQANVITDKYHRTNELYQKIGAENRKAYDFLQKNLVQLAELTNKLNVRLGVKNNLTDTDDE